MFPTGRPMRILLISNFYPPQMVGGYERAMADYAYLLWARGHEVQVLTTTTREFTQPHDPRPAHPSTAPSNSVASGRAQLLSGCGRPRYPHGSLPMPKS